MWVGRSFVSTVLILFGLGESLVDHLVDLSAI